MGFTNLDKAGMLTFGFDKLATMIGFTTKVITPNI
jgi:hypothetical protein